VEVGVVAGAVVGGRGVIVVATLTGITRTTLTTPVVTDTIPPVLRRIIMAHTRTTMVTHHIRQVIRQVSIS
jgi:hypothetical protein